MKNYRIDFAHNTIIMDYTFAKEAQTIGSAAYEDLKRIKADFPTMTTRVASHREQKEPHHNKNLTYSNMIKYIMTFENSTELLAEFTLVQSQSVVAKQPYSIVRNWFVDKFPEYTTPKSKVVPKESFKSFEKSISETAPSKKTTVGKFSSLA